MPKDVGLSAKVYTSEYFLDCEQRSLFTQQWICVGLADLSNCCNSVPVYVARMLILLVCDRHSQIIDPLFIAPEAGNFKRQSNSPVYLWKISRTIKSGNHTKQLRPQHLLITIVCKLQILFH